MYKCSILLHSQTTQCPQNWDLSSDNYRSLSEVGHFVGWVPAFEGGADIKIAPGRNVSGGSYSNAWSFELGFTALALS